MNENGIGQGSDMIEVKALVATLTISLGWAGSVFAQNDKAALKPVLKNEGAPRTALKPIVKSAEGKGEAPEMEKPTRVELKPQPRGTVSDAKPQASKVSSAPA